MATGTRNWLGHKTAEREPYLRRSPIAVIERDGRILAFANVWMSANKHKLSGDLTRYDDQAPKGAMDSSSPVATVRY